MKKLRWLLWLTLSFGVIFAENNEDSTTLDQQEEMKRKSFFYTGFGLAMPFMVPGVNGGYRLKMKNHALDIHGSVFFIKQTLGMKGDQTYIDYVDQNTQRTGVATGVTYLYYFGKSPFYVGAGVDVGMQMMGMFPIAQLTTPHGVIGYEGEKFFHQIVVSPVSYSPIGTHEETKATYHVGFKF
jgi:hypothetical protein